MNYSKEIYESGDFKRQEVSFWDDESAIGVVEIVLILVVLVALVIIFKSQLTSLFNNIFGSISQKAETVYS